MKHWGPTANYFMINGIICTQESVSKSYLYEARQCFVRCDGHVVQLRQSNQQDLIQLHERFKIRKLRRRTTIYISIVIQGVIVAGRCGTVRNVLHDIHNTRPVWIRVIRKDNGLIGWLRNLVHRNMYLSILRWHEWSPDTRRYINSDEMVWKSVNRIS